MEQRWAGSHMPEQHGRLAVITGANSGLGFEIARALASQGASIVLAVRDVHKGGLAARRVAEAVAGAEISVQRLDLASLASVRDAAEELRSTHPTVDLLINNAGVMHTPKQRTRDGFELQFGTNHLGHFALTGLLLDKMLPVPGSRVVTVSSIGHRFLSRIDFDDLHAEQSYSRVAAYSRSKLANLMFTYELQRRLSGQGTTISVAAHPGAANTDLMRNLPSPLRALVPVVAPLFTQSPAMGALPTLRAATDPRVLGGQYYGPDRLFESRGRPRLVESSAQSHDTTIQRRLWAVSEQLTGVVFPV
ncbi:SDR family NAD(P)-dependent oxidoreductase [Nocardia sp. NPDC049220]|uniref:SDR family NAD(P)-dependent oxidoreductase n=1 Tax=Nocardia sp. NPDC049220 TaxID=3155273 RepID=UPI0033DD4B8D